MVRQEPIDVLFLMDTCDGARGGTENQVLQLLQALDPARARAHVCLLRESPHLAETPFANGAKVLGVHRMLSLNALRRMLELGRWIRRSRIRVVHVLFNDSSILAPFFCKLASAKVVASRRDLGFWYTPGILRALRASNLFVDRIVANSDAVRQVVTRAEWVRPAKVGVIYNGHDMRRFEKPPLDGFRERLGIGSDDPIVGMVANFHQLKRHCDLLDAFARLRTRHPTAHLVLAGTGREEAAIRRRMTALGLAARVHLLGFVPDAVPIVKHFTVGVLCSETEGLSNAIIEYLACGKPVVCTRVGGNPELVSDGENGFLVPVGDVAALADRLDRILTDGALARRLGEGASGSRLAHLSAGEMAEAYMRLYEEILE